MWPNPERRIDRGASSAEYAGLIVLAALILGALVPLVTGNLGQHVEYALCKILQGGSAGSCESPEDQRYKPDYCLLGLTNEFYGGQVDVAIVRAGKDLSFIRTTTVDNKGNKTVRLTAVDNSQLGVGTGVGVGANGGGVNIGADAQINAGVKVGIGDTWMFTGKDAEKKADGMVGDIREQATIDAVKDSGPVGWLAGGAYDAAAGPDVRDSDLNRYEMSVNADGSVGAGLGLGPGNPKGKHAKGRKDPKDKDQRGDNGVTPNADVSVGIDGTEKAIVEENKKTGESAVTMMLSGSGSAQEHHIWDGHRYVRNYGGMMRVNKDKNGTITSIDLTRMTADGGKAQWVTNHLQLDTDAERQTVADYMLSDVGTKAGQTMLNLTWDDMAPTDPPGSDATPLQKLLYEKGQTTKQDYTYDSKQNNYGAHAKLGLMLGANVSAGSTGQQLTGAQYLGAPGPDGKRSYRNYTECHS